MFVMLISEQLSLKLKKVSFVDLMIGKIMNESKIQNK
jgi:hypothetical protein